MFHTKSKKNKKQVEKLAQPEISYKEAQLPPVKQCSFMKNYKKPNESEKKRIYF